MTTRSSHLERGRRRGHGDRKFFAGQNRTSRLAGAALLLSTCFALSGCSTSQEYPLAETQWAITQMYLTPEDPAVTPTGASIAFGQRSAVITTGCAPIQATVSYHNNTVSFGNLQVGEINSSCTGMKQFVHDNLLRLFTQTLTVSLHGTQDATLTVKDGDQVTTASLRLSTIAG